MLACQNCKKEVNTTDVICTLCRFPFRGTEKEQASFIAKQIIQKSDVIESIQRLKNSRIILFVLGAFYLIVPFIPLLSTPSNPIKIFSVALGIIFIGFGLLTFKKPKIALLIPLSLTVLYYLILLITDPVLLWTGIFWKVVILVSLCYGYFSVKKSETILKENEYLASTFGFEVNHLYTAKKAV